MFPFFRGRAKNQQQHSKSAKRRLRVERLEDRSMLTTFAVTTLSDHGAGSFRQALLDANRTAGTDTINFQVAGTIQLTGGALPTVMSNVDINGSSAPGFAGTPKVEIDFHGFSGLQFAAGSAGSTLASLSLVDASGSAVTLNHTSGVTVEGNYIGLALNGTTVGANKGDGITVSFSTGNTIGGTSATDRNVISGNGNNGITLNGSSTNTIEGNYIGTDASGTLDRGNTGNGILLAGISKNNTVGGTDGNLVSGNNANGIMINGQSSANSVAGNTIGLAANGTTVLGNSQDGVKIQNATGNTIGSSTVVNNAFQLSNVISGNGASGVELSAASGNTVAMNYIGTDVTGSLARGNSANGILIDAGSANNLIGGEATGGNDPTNGTFVRPPQGNLISGNTNDGVLIDGGATGNQLSGNFIGTTAGGSVALGNGQNGVAIVGANNNILLGCLFTTTPFVFYNVIDGNGANGLLVDNSNGTTIQANFFGIGANNTAGVGNRLNGVIIEGSSANTLMGGPIPLGNVDGANGLNGIVVQDQASGFTSYNTFDGGAAFSSQPNLGNGHDGMLFTTTGTNILVRTCIIVENANDGVEISGAATGVRFVGNFVGLAVENGTIVAMGNKNNGIEVDGNANGDIIGGPQPTFNIVPQNTISDNGGYGVEIDGTAHNIAVNNSYIGTDPTGVMALANGKAGVYIGPGTYSNTIGSTDSTLTTIISGNLGDGIQLNGTTGNTVVGTHVGTDTTGALPLPNHGSGIELTNSSKNTIGSTSSTTPKNAIGFNTGSGVLVNSGTQNGILNNSILSNSSLGINLGAGANLNQAAPVLTSVEAVSGGTQVMGTLTSTPNTTFTLEFFANATSGASGRDLLGSVQVTIGQSGTATFTFTGAALPSGDTYVTATATDSKNNTSEFSAALA